MVGDAGFEIQWADENDKQMLVVVCLDCSQVVSHPMYPISPVVYNDIILEHEKECTHKVDM